MHPTPRTEEARVHNSELSDRGHGLSDYVHVAFARKIERELIELREAVLDYHNISDTEYGLGYCIGEEQDYAPRFLRMFRALRNSRTWPS